MCFTIVFDLTKENRKLQLLPGRSDLERRKPSQRKSSQFQKADPTTTVQSNGEHGNELNAPRGLRVEEEPKHGQNEMVGRINGPYGLRSNWEA